MGKKKPAPPPTPDYAGQAAAQGQANQAAGVQSAALSNPNVYSPYGNQTVSYDATGPNGAMVPTIRQTLTPEAQAALTAQQNVQAQQADLASRGMTQAADIIGQPFRYSGPDVQTSFNQGPSAQTGLDLSGIAAMPINAGMTAQNAIMSRLDPQLQRDEAAQRTRLINQGMTPGGEAYNADQTLFNQGRNDLYTQAGAAGLNLDMLANQQGFNQALQKGGFYNQGLAQNFNQNQAYAQFQNAAGDQSLQRQLALRNQPLNEISALMAGSQIQAPVFQQYSGQNIAAAPVFDASKAQGQFLQDSYGQQMAGYNSDMQAMAQLGSSAMGMFSPKPSDVRLKSNIVRVGTHPLGIGIYEYDIFDRRERGVMAHEVETVRPNAVIIHPSGYKLVDYGALQ